MGSPFRIPPARPDPVRGRDRVRLTIQAREMRRENRNRGEGGGRASPCAADGARSVARPAAPDGGCRLSQRRAADNYLVSHSDLVSGWMAGYVV